MTKDRRIIVSYTSFPAAIQFAVLAARSVLDGSVKPDKLILYLTASQFPDGKLPSELTTLIKENPLFEVKFYEENIRSYTKLIPALKDFPDDIIVTIDDDIAYNKDMLKDLLRLHKKYPQAIVAHRVRHLKIDAPYSQWKIYSKYRYFIKTLRPRFVNLQTGVGGVLYPPNCLKPQMLDSKIFMEVAPTVDDIWFWAAAVANGTKIAPVPFSKPKQGDLNKPNEISLRIINTEGGEDINYITFKNILVKYPVIKERIENDK
ncbi:MAG: glycosyltransferase [Paludibacter sp.]|nr:glycosyltransferase [Paludibacter sp.]